MELGAFLKLGNENLKTWFRNVNNCEAVNFVNAKKLDLFETEIFQIMWTFRAAIFCELKLETEKIES